MIKCPKGISDEKIYSLQLITFSILSDKCSGKM
jgi:hypothetical protein